MASRVVLVNGLPGSGKTTLAEALAAALAAPLLSKDKEALAGTLPPQGATPELGGIAMDTLWALARATAGMVVLESYWFRPRDLTFAEAGLTGLGGPGWWKSGATSPASWRGRGTPAASGTPCTTTRGG